MVGSIPLTLCRFLSLQIARMQLLERSMMEKDLELIRLEVLDDKRMGSAYRGNGIIQHILDALKDWSKSKGINELRLEVYNENIIAKKAYVKAGFTPNLLEMRIEI